MESISRDQDICWLAGVIDGEGSIGFLRNGTRAKQGNGCVGQARVYVRNTCPYLIQKVSRIFVTLGLSFYYTFEKSYMRPSGNSTKDSLKICCSGSTSIRNLLQAILPHLTTKRREAELMLDYLTWRFTEIPKHFSRNDVWSQRIIERQEALIAALAACKRQVLSLQRLPRSTSKVLDLTNLEVKV